MFRVAYKALRGRPGLAVLSIISIAMAVGLAVSVPVFAQAVSRGIMEEEMRAFTAQVQRSPLAIRVYLVPSSKRPVSFQQCWDTAASIAHIYESNLGILVRSGQLMVESPGLMFKTAQEGPYGKAGSLLGNTKLALLSDIEDHMEILSGQPMGTSSTGEVIDVWMHDSWAMEMGVVAGEQFVIQPILRPVPIKIRIAGTWQPKDAHDLYWPVEPSGLKSVLLIQPQDYTQRIEPYFGGSVGSASWLINLDEARFVPEIASRYVQGFKRTAVQLQQLLPGSKSDVSPLPMLEAHLERQRPLTILLFSFSVPIIGFVLYFLTLISNIFVDSQRRITATMVSRGMDIGQIFRINLYQSLILLTVGTPLGALIGLGVARAMGHTSSFLRFEVRSPLAVSPLGINLWLVLLTMGVSLFARLLPVIQQRRLSIVDYTRESSRSESNPLWQRFYLDLMLIIPTAYAYRQLKQQGTIALLGWHSSGDVFRDPLVFLVPALFMLTASLLCARIFPLLMRFLDRFVSQHLSLVWCLTVRQLGRQGKQYVSALLLIMASLSVGVFVASMALSLDQWLEDRMHYRLGSDIVFQLAEEPELLYGNPDPMGGGTESFANVAEWLVPWDKLLEIPGVEGATSVGNYRAQLPVSPNSLENGWFLAIDRLSFPSAAAFRQDFAGVPLGELMNQLASHSDGVLVSAKFLEGSGRAIGDPLNVKVSPDGTNQIELKTVIVGVFDYFPTIYEQDAPAVVGNLDYLLSSAGGAAAYNIWLRADSARIQREDLPKALTAAVRYYTRYKDVWTLIDEEHEKKERIGVYGTLSIGFLASLALAGIGLLIQYQKSLQERLFRFAAMRAIGLSRRQLVVQVQLEYLAVLSLGLLAGVFIGIQASQLFIPFFRVSTADGHLPLPPLAMLLDRHSIAIMAVAFGLVQLAAQSSLIHRAMRSQLSLVLRMGSEE